MFDELKANIKTLNELMWDGRLPWLDVEAWLANFSGKSGSDADERLHALFLLSHFSYFNSAVLRELLRALYRDFVQYPIVARLRRANNETSDWGVIAPLYRDALKRVRFIGIGNPSASGTHLLYYFRQENDLPTKSFVHPHELFTKDGKGNTKLVDGIDQIVFLDDFCGSGVQATQYSAALLARVVALDTSVRLSYYPLFATSQGLQVARAGTHFTEVETLCELDASFRALDPGSRYFRETLEPLRRDFAYTMCKDYGDIIEPQMPLGFAGNQLLLGFAHNIPDNTLPIFWSLGRRTHPWTPAFRRYTKHEGW